MSNPTTRTAAGSTYALLPSAPVANRYVQNLETLLNYYLQREGPDRAASEPQLRFAWALARYRFTPPNAKMLAERAQVMVFGGAGTGKSSVVNVFVGDNVAEVNAQAGYTRHPTAFFWSDSSDINELWPASLGQLKRSDQSSPAVVDDDRYDYRRLENPVADPGYWRRHVLWDGPDLTTKHAQQYETRAIEIAGLADVCIYVASDERYNDELPTNFLQAMLEAGKPVVVVLTKVFHTDAEEFEKLFRDQVVAKLKQRERILAVVVVPAPTTGKSADLWSANAPFGQSMRNAVEKATADFDDLRRIGRERAAEFLRGVQHRLLDPLRLDMAEYRAWIELVRKAGNDAVLRYEREFLQPRSMATAVDGELLKVFEAPSVLTPVNRVLEYLREPYRFLRSFWSGRVIRSDRKSDANVELSKVCRGIFESLRVQSSARKARHPLWTEIHAGLPAAEKESTAQFEKLRARQSTETEQRLTEIGKERQDKLLANPIVVVGAQSTRLVVDILAVGLAGYCGGLRWFTVVLMLLAVGLIEELARLAAAAYGKHQREDLVRQQKEQVRESIRTAYLDVLARQPPQSGPWLIQLARVEEQLGADLETLAGTPSSGVVKP